VNTAWKGMMNETALVQIAAGGRVQWSFEENRGRW
jgi:hypothetical protein